MKRGTVLLLVTLLATAAILAAAGSGAVSSFTANRSSNMVVVNDTDGFIGISGDSEHWAFEDGSGRFYLDFTESNENAIGEGFNARALTRIDEAFSLTNQGTRPVYVWFESSDWPWQANAILAYRINEDNTTGDITRADVWFYKRDAGLNLLSGDMTSFQDGVGEQAYVYLEPGESFAVDIIVNTANSVYGNDGLDLSHTVVIRADEDAPQQPGTYH